MSEDKTIRGDKTQATKRHEELGFVLGQRGVKMKPGSLRFYQKAPEGFGIKQGVFYQTEADELVCLGGSFNEALVAAREGNKSWAGVIGMTADKTQTKPGQKATGAMTTGQKAATAFSILLTGTTLGSGIGALEEAGWGKTAGAAKGLVGLLGIAAQASDNPAVKATGLLALGGVTYDAGRKHVAPFVALGLPNANEADVSEEPLDMLDQHREQAPISAPAAQPRIEAPVAQAAPQTDATSRPLSQGDPAPVMPGLGEPAEARELAYVEVQHAQGNGLAPGEAAHH